VVSDILEMNRDRKNRKNAEKMAIRVERSISDNEGEGQKNRIAASSAKCKENMAGWTFYQGQLSRDLVWAIHRQVLARARATRVDTVHPHTACGVPRLAGSPDHMKPAGRIDRSASIMTVERFEPGRRFVRRAV